MVRDSSFSVRFIDDAFRVNQRCDLRRSAGSLFNHDVHKESTRSTKRLCSELCVNLSGLLVKLFCNAKTAKKAERDAKSEQRSESLYVGFDLLAKHSALIGIVICVFCRQFSCVTPCRSVSVVLKFEPHST